MSALLKPNTDLLVAQIDAGNGGGVYNCLGGDPSTCTTNNTKAWLASLVYDPVLEDTHAYTRTRAYTIHIYTHIHIYAHTQYTHTYMHTQYTHTHMHIQTYTHKHTHTHTRMA